jgi:hypothetical protein
VLMQGVTHASQARVLVHVAQYQPRTWVRSQANPGRTIGGPRPGGLSR